MKPFARLLSVPLIALAYGCAAGVEAARPPMLPDPEPPPPVEEPEPPPREPTRAELQESWARPFQVETSGETPMRYVRMAAVRVETTDTVGASRPEPAAPPADSAAATRPVSPARAPGATPSTTHRVQSGETFYAIARRYSIPPATLRAANPDVDPERLRSGTVLRIPGGAVPVPAAPPAAPAQRDERRPAPAAGARTHRVARGETLFGIARRYGVSPEAIRRANPLEGDVVKIGQTLVIPGR